nr:ATP-dependent DNA ligase [Pithovirus mammoth]
MNLEAFLNSSPLSVNSADEQARNSSPGLTFQSPQSQCDGLVFEETSTPHFRFPVDEVLTYDQTPTRENWALIPLYKTTLEGKQSIWQVGFDASSERIWVLHGLMISVPQLKTRQISTNSSGRTIQQQAFLEARNRYKKNYHKGYRPAQGEVVIHKPMLANKYKEGSIKEWPAAIQPKLDGIRARIFLSPSGVEIRSRTNRDWTHLAHLREEAALLLDFLPPGTHLDGEVYSSEISFDKLSGTMRTTKGKRVDEDKLHYHVFDIIEPSNSYFEVRIQMMNEAFRQFQGTKIHLVPTFLISSHQQVLDHHQHWVSLGYEGCILRRVSTASSTEKGKALALYKADRCNNLLKFKSFDDEEVWIIGVTQGAGTEEGLAILQVQDATGNVLEVRPRGNFETRRQWFENPSLVIGKRYTIRFFGKTEKGVPRFPVGIAIRDYE